jgi:hypothetical protein
LSVKVRAVLKVGASVVVAILVVCLTAFAWMTFAPRRVPPGQPALSTLDASSLRAFRDAFNASDGEVRVLAMLSPT